MIKYYAIHCEDYMKEIIDEDLMIFGDKIVSNHGWIYSTIYISYEDAESYLLEDGFKEISNGLYILDTKDARHEATIDTVKVFEKLNIM